jgi:hypothetical protein
MSLRDYVRFHLQLNGPEVELYRFQLTPAEHQTLGQLAMDGRWGSTSGFCAYNCAIFARNLERFSSLSGRFQTPSGLARDLRELTQGADAQGTCEVADGGPCR